MGQRRLAGARQAGEEDGKALPVTRRSGAANLLEDGGRAEPGGDGQVEFEPSLQLVVLQSPWRHAVRHFPERQVFGSLFHVDGLLDRYDFDLEVVSMIRQQLLRGRRIEPVVIARAGVVLADDHSGEAEVLADDGVEQRFARTGLAAVERHCRQQRGLLRQGVQRQLVAAHAGEVVDQPLSAVVDDGMDDEVGALFPGAAGGKGDLCGEHRRAAVKGQRPVPAAAPELGAQFGRSIAVAPKGVAWRWRDAANLAADVDGVATAEQGDARMGRVGRAVAKACLRCCVGRPEIVDAQCGDQQALGVMEGNVVARFQLRGEGLGDVEHDRQRPHQAVGEAQVLNDAAVFPFAGVARQRGEGPAHQQFDVAELRRCQRPCRVVGGARFFPRQRVPPQVEVDQATAVRRGDGAHEPACRCSSAA